MKWYHPFRIFRKGSIYTKTFCGTLALSVCVLSIFYISIGRMNLKHHKEQITASNLSLLQISASSLEVTMDMLSQGMTQTMWNQDFIDFMVNPSGVDQELIYRISQQLRSTVSSNSLVSRAYFYSPFSDTVFHGGNSILSKATMADRGLLQAYEALDPLSGWNEARTAARIFFYEDRLFLFQELNIATHIGTLIYEMNLTQIQNRLLLPRESGGAILVYDQDGNPIFQTGEADSPTPDWQDEEAFITERNMSEQMERGQGEYFLYQSQTGWKFLLPVDHDSLRISWPQMLSMYLPVFLLLTIVGLLLSLYVSHMIYRPINHLMRVVSPSSRDIPLAGSEVDILETAYSSVLEEHAQLQGVVSNIAPEILESMLKNLLIGKHLTQERVTQILHGVNNPISVQGRFFVIACQIVPGNARNVDDTEINLYLLAIRNLTHRLSNPECTIYDIRTDILTMALICCFPEDRSLSQLNQECRRIQETLRLHTEAMPFQLFFARGKFYPNLLDVRYSYQEAIERVQYQRYLHSTGETPPAPPEEPFEGGELVLDQALLQSRAKDIMDRASDNAPAQAESLMERVLEEIQRQSRDDQELKHYLQMLQDQLVERVITYPLSQEDQHTLSEYSLISTENRTLSAQEALQAVRMSARTLFRISASYSQKNRYKYVEQAKRYVNDNYMDSNLSLSSVGDFVGISASYLSEVWSETSHEKFSVYLATLRTEKAQQLLISTTLSIKEIGFRCGFNSVQNFIRVFKKYTGMPPGQFRENLPRQGD